MRRKNTLAYFARLQVKQKKKFFQTQTAGQRQSIFFFTVLILFFVFFFGRFPFRQAALPGFTQKLKLKLGRQDMLTQPNPKSSIIVDKSLY
jgi:hypothetical protein